MDNRNYMLSRMRFAGHSQKIRKILRKHRTESLSNIYRKLRLDSEFSMDWDNGWREVAQSFVEGMTHEYAAVILFLSLPGRIVPDDLTKESLAFLDELRLSAYCKEESGALNKRREDDVPTSIMFFDVECLALKRIASLKAHIRKIWIMLSLSVILLLLLTAWTLVGGFYIIP